MKLTDQLPHYVKAETIGFCKQSETNADLVTDFMQKYCQPDRFSEIKKSMSKHLPLAKFKVKPELNAVPRTKKTHLSLREKREIGLYKVSRKGLNYQEFLKLNKLWTQYMLDSLDFPHFANKKGEVDVVDRHWEQLSTQLYKADYHGAQLTVIRARCPSLIGLQGIVVMDTKKTFKLLGKDNIVRTIPKELSVFQFQVAQFKLTAYGRHLCIRPAERSTKKIRNNLLIDL